MNKYLYSILLFFSLLLTGCDKDFDFSTKSLETLQPAHKFTFGEMGLASAAEFNPVSVRIKGDTIFIANNAVGFTGVIMLSKSSGAVIKHLTSWDFQGNAESFDNQITDVAISDKLLFVVNRSSRIDVFNRTDWSYVTTIGKTGWQSSSLLQCESADVAGNQLFIRDKHKIIVVNIADCTPANRFKNINHIVAQDSTSQNNGFNLQSVATHNGLVYVSDFERSRILVINPASASEKNGKLKYEQSIITASKPLAFAMNGNQIFIVCNDNSIVKRDLKTGKTITTFSTLGSEGQLKNPGKLIFHDGSLYLTSRSSATPYMIKNNISKIEVTTVK